MSLYVIFGACVTFSMHWHEKPAEWKEVEGATFKPVWAVQAEEGRNFLRKTFMQKENVAMTWIHTRVTKIGKKVLQGKTNLVDH